jgi:hypothetical protein
MIDRCLPKILPQNCILKKNCPVYNCIIGIIVGARIGLETQ